MKELDKERAWSYALTLLSRRSYTVAEVSERLVRRQASTEVIDEVILRLKHYRLVDDEAFAEAYVRTHSARKGSLALRFELRRKGVPEEVSESALQPLDEAAQTESAVSLLNRQAWRLKGGDERRNRARAFAFLARRGFPGDTVSAALERCPWLTAGDEQSEFDHG
ncbi:MAG: regulatory protein RecX [Trueperaceae bacterium]